MKKIISVLLCLLMLCSVTAFAAETETVGGKITLTQFLGVSREQAKTVRLATDAAAAVGVDADVFYAISDHLTLTSAFEPKVMEDSGLYITIEKTDGTFAYAFIGREGGADVYSLAMNRLPYALYTADHLSLVGALTALADGKPQILVYSNFDVVIDGQKAAFHHEVFSDENGRMLVPAREICGYLNKRIYWFNSPARVAVSAVPADPDNTGGGGAGGDSICFTIGEKNYEINGRLHETDTAARLVDGSAYIPLRTLAEFLGYHVAFVPLCDL